MLATSSQTPFARPLGPMGSPSASCTCVLGVLQGAKSICAEDSIWPALWSHACSVRRPHRQQTPALQQGTYTHSAEACVKVKCTHMACRAPALFAALLHRAGVAPALLPLLAEPARAAIQGLGILGRRGHPGHTAAFLASLKEICDGASSDARLVMLSPCPVMQVCS